MYFVPAAEFCCSVPTVDADVVFINLVLPQFQNTCGGFMLRATCHDIAVIEAVSARVKRPVLTLSSHLGHSLEFADTKSKSVP